MEWEARVAPPPAVIDEPPRRLAIEAAPPVEVVVERERKRVNEPWYNEQDRYIEREVEYRGGPPRRW